MSPRLRNWTLIALASGVGIAVFASLYQRTMAVDLERHAAASETLRELEHLNAVAQEEALAARFNLRNHYDPLTRVLAESTQNVGRLREDVRAAVGLDHELDAAISDLSREQEATARQVERFKSQNSILKNSLYYLPLAAEELNVKLRESGRPELARLVPMIDRLVRATLVCNLLRSDANRSVQAEALSAVAAEGERMSGPLAGDLALVLAHARTVAREQDVVDPMLGELLGPSSARRIATVDELYTLRFQTLSARVDLYRKVLYGWSLVLLGGLIVAALKLRRVYANLERMVKERTRELDRAVKELWGEMLLAKMIQTALVPKHIALDGCDVAAAMRPTDEVGGDYYDVVRSKDADWILIGDASGHGVPAGLVMMMCQTAVRTVLHEDPAIGPDRLLTTVNRTLTENIRLLGEDKYMTMHALRRAPDGSFRFSGMHQDIFIYRAATGSIETLEPSGCFLGLQEDISGMLDVRSFELRPGDAVLLYTDGITEAKKGSSMLDNDGLRDIFERLARRPAQQILDGILAHLASYEVHDDVAAIVVKQC
jgi:serine phosphatase RsbU (regulator of sigma subunit)